MIKYSNEFAEAAFGHSHDYSNVENNHYNLKQMEDNDMETNKIPQENKLPSITKNLFDLL